MQNTDGNRNAMNYHLFAPKFENHVDSTGYEDTWTRPHLQDNNWSERKQPMQEFGGQQGRDYHPGMPPGNTDEGPKRGERTAMPGRTAPMPGMMADQRTVSHPLAERQYETPFPNREQQIDQFNRRIDSMHMPDDLQRPVATRDVVKKAHDEKLLGSSAGSDRVASSLAFEDPVFSRTSRQLSAGANDYIADRAFSASSGANGAGVLGGTFEDMFY